MQEVLDLIRTSIKQHRTAIAEAMTTPFPGGYANIAGAWSVGSSDNNVSGTNYPAEIPEEWQRANEALQEVQQQSSKSSLPSVGTPSPSVSPKTTNKQYPVTAQHQFGPMGYPVAQHQQYWAPPMYPFPGYPGYMGNYGYCPMPFRNGYEAYQLYGMASQSQQPPVSVVSTNTSELKNSESLVSATDTQLQQENCQPPPPLPPPPPPAPPAEEDEEDEKLSKPSFSPKNKQAPGSGGIRFSIPQRKAQQGNGLLTLKNKKSVDSFGKPPSSNPFYIDLASSDEESKDILNNDFPLNHRKNEDASSENAETRMDSSSRETTMSKIDPLTDAELRAYVRRGFDKCLNDQEKDEMAILMRKICKKVFGLTDEYGNTINPGIDWKSEPLPLLSREQNHFDSRDTRMNSPMSKNSTPFRASPPSNQYSSPRNFKFKRGSYQKQLPRRRHQMHSRSRSRSKSRSPVSRRVVRRRYSSGSESPDSSRGSYGSSSKQSMSSSVVEPDNRVRNNSHSSSNKKKKNKKKNKLAFTVDSEFSSSEKLQKRAARFDLSGNKKSGGSIVLTINNPLAGIDDASDIDWSTYAIVGTCQDIEKPFLRITSAVDPATIRPVEVLFESLKMVKKHWTENQDYHFACEQLKSIRQDLVVQCIRNEFTVHAYETHARIALEKGDHTEFNQCQSQLKVLYDEVKNTDNKLEFTGYRILYNMFTEDTREIKNIIANLTAEEKNNQVISHSLKLVQAWILNSYHVFFKLYVSAPKMSGFLIDWFVVKIRKAALKAYIKAYRPTIPVTFLHKELGFSGLEETLAFLQEVQCILNADKSALLTKESNSAAL